MTMRRLLAFLSLACLPLRTHAQPTGSEIPVNAAPELSQSFSRVAMDGSGRFVVVWQSDLHDGSLFGIYLRRFGITGAALGGDTQVNTTTDGEQTWPGVATDDAGNVVVVWEGDDAGGRGIFARLFSAAGAPLTGEIAVNATSAGDQRRPSVAMSASGAFVVAWEGPDADLTGIYAQRFDAAGTPQGPELALNGAADHAQRFAVVAADSAGRFVAAWESNLQDGSGRGIYARRFESDGAARDASEFRVNTATAGDQERPALASALNGDFVVVWHAAQAGDSDGGVFAQRYLQNGAPQGAEFRVNATGVGRQYGGAVGMDANGNFVVAWTGPDADAEGVFGRRYRADGTPLGAEFAANTTTAGMQGEAAVAMNRKLQPLVDSRVFALSWTSPDADLEGITARLADFGNSVTVAAPDDGRAWSVGSSQRIRFAHTLPFATRGFRIELIVNGGAPEVLQASFTAGRTVGNYQHASVADPGFPGGPFTGVIRVTSTADPEATDDSTPFPIELPAISVLQPPPDVIQGAPTEVKWGHNLGLQSLVTVELARDGTTFDETLSPPQHAVNGWVHEGRLAWTPTGACAMPGACRIRVSWTKDTSVFGVSAPFDISAVIFVDNSAAPGGNGSRAQPYNTLAAAETASLAGGIVFVYAGDGTTTGYATGFALKDRQRLIGEGVGLVLNGVTLVPAGTPPRLTKSSGSVVRLARDNEVAGLTLQAQVTAGIQRSGALGAASVHDVAIQIAALTDGIRLDATPTGTLTLDDNTITGATSQGAGGINVIGGSATVTGTGNTMAISAGRLVTVTGTTGGDFLLTGGTLSSTNASTSGVMVFNSNSGASNYVFDNVSATSASSVGVSAFSSPSASITFNDLDVATVNGPALVLNNVGSLTINPGATGSNLVATGGPALDAVQTSLAASLRTLSSTSSSGAGLSLSNVAGSLIAEDGAITGPAATAISVSAGTVAVDYPGSVTKTANGRLVVITNRPSGAGTISLSGDLSCSGSCAGIDVSSNAGGTVTFSGASKSVTTTVAAPAVGLGGNVGARVNFTGGGLAISTALGTGFQISGNAAAVTVTGPGNTIATGGGVGVLILGATIGGSGITFDSVSVNDGPNGIVVENATGGPFRANGGALQNVTTRGVDVNLGNSDVSYAGSITTAGPAARSVEITSRTGGAVTLSGDITDASLGILVQNNLSGPSTVTFSGASKSFSTGANSAVQLLSNAPGSVHFTGGGLHIATTTGSGLVSSGGLVALNVSGPDNTVSTTTGTAVSLAGPIGGGAILFERVDVDGAANGILLSNAGPLVFTGKNGALQNVTSRGLDVFGGSGDVSYAGSITTAGPNARSVEITDRTGGAVTLSGDIQDTGQGILVQNNGSGSPTITFSGVKAITTGGNPAVQLLNNPSATINFSEGQLLIGTGAGAGFTATGGAAAINVTGMGNTISTTTGTAVNISGATIGAGGIVFDSVSASGAANGIVIANAGAGSFSAQSGGLQGVTNRGLDVDGGSGHVSYGGTISTVGTFTRSVEITNRTGGTVTLSGGITDTSGGILIQNNGSGSPTFTFSGATKTLSTGGQIPVQFLNNATATLNFENGGLDIDTTNNGLFVSGGGTVNVNGTSNTIDTVNGSAVVLVGGTLNVGGQLAATASGPNGIGVNVGGGVSAIGGSGLAVNAAAGTGFRAASSGSVSVTGTGHTITTTTGTAVSIRGGIAIDAAGIRFASVSVDGAATGIQIENAGAGAFRADGGSLRNVTTRGLLVSSGSGDVSYAGTISTSGTAARSVEIQLRTGGAITLSGAITDTSQGILINGNTAPGASVLFSGGLDLRTGANTAFLAMNNAGGISVAATQDNVAIVNTITTTLGTALNVADTAIGAAGLTFRSVSSPTPSSATGIILSRTGSSGGLTITGDGNPGSGGTIAGKTGSDLTTSTGIGVYLNDTARVSLAWMQLNDFQNYAIRGLNVDGFALADSVVNTTSGTNGTNGPLDEGSVSFGVRDGTNGLTGTASIARSTIESGVRDNLSVFNSAGTLTLTLADVSVHRGRNHGVAVQALGTATVNVTVKNSAFSANAGSHFDALAEESANLHVSFGDGGANLLSGGSAGSPRQNVAIQTGVAWSGVGSANVSNNTIEGAGETPIDINVGGTGTFTATVHGNTIGTSGVAGSGSSGGRDAIRVVASGDKSIDATPDGGSLTVAITNNTLQQVSGSGIVVIGRDGGTSADPIELNATVAGNVLREPAPGRHAILVQSGESNSPTPDDVRLHADVGGGGAFANTVQGDWGGGPFAEIRLQHGFSATSRFILTGLGANTSNTAAVTAYLAGRNVLGGGAASATLAGGGVYETGGAPPQPLMAAALDVPTPPSGAAAVGRDQLGLLARAALRRWAPELSAEERAVVQGLRFELADLPVGQLGAFSEGRIVLDADAAGRGWFVDPTPLEDTEFAVAGGAHARRYDLLTALLHEIGHALGRRDLSPHEHAGAMAASLPPGTRRAALARLED